MMIQRPAAGMCLLVVSLLMVDDGWAVPETPSVTLERAVHFAAADGSDLTVAAGTYRIEQPSGMHLRIVGDGPPLTVDIPATATTHEESIASPLALIIAEEGQDDALHLVFLLPDGQSLDAAATYSGTRPRGSPASPLNRSQLQQAVRQVQLLSQSSINSSSLRVSPGAATGPATASTEFVETTGMGTSVTWNYIAMHHPELMAQTLADIQVGTQPKASVAGLATESELNDMLKINWSAEASRLAAIRDTLSKATVAPRGLPGGLSVYDQVALANPKQSSYTALLKALPLALPQKNLGSVWAGQHALGIVSITAPADGYIEARLNLNATNRHFRIVKATTFTGEVLTGTLVASLVIPGGQYQDVVLDPANPPAQISKAGFVSFLAKKGQRIDVTVVFEPVALGMTPVGDNEATLELSGATSSDFDIVTNTPSTPSTWSRTASIRARFEGINFGVLGSIDNTAITMFRDGTPCNRVVPVPASITFVNAEQQARNISVTAESLAPALHVQPFTVSLGPGERKQVPIPIQIDSCPAEGVEHTGTIKFRYAGVVRRAALGVTLYTNMHHWRNASRSVGSCDYTWDIYIRPDGNTHLTYSLRNRNLIFQKQLDFRFMVLGQEIGRGVLRDGPNTLHTKTNGYRHPSSFVRDNYVPMLSAPASVKLTCSNW